MVPSSAKCAADSALPRSRDHHCRHRASRPTRRPKHLKLPARPVLAGVGQQSVARDQPQMRRNLPAMQGMVMHHRQARLECHRPSLFPGPPAEIDVLVIKEVIRIETAQLLQASPPDQQTAAGHPIDGLMGASLLGNICAGCAARPAAAVYSEEWEWAGRELLTAVGIGRNRRPTMPRRGWSLPSRSTRARASSRKPGGSVTSGLRSRIQSPWPRRQPSLTARAKPRLPPKRRSETPDSRRSRPRHAIDGRVIIDDDNLGGASPRASAGAKLLHEKVRVLPGLIIDDDDGQPGHGRRGADPVCWARWETEGNSDSVRVHRVPSQGRQSGQVRENGGL